MFRELDLKPVYDSSEYDLVKDLITPLLKNSVRYNRGVGYFSSGWIKLAAQGLCEFAEHGSKAKIIMSPIISEQDWEAMRKGNEAQDDKKLLETLTEITKDLVKALQEDTLNAFAWLIADEVLSIKFAIPKGKLHGGDFHDKFAIFEDESGDRVAIHGSYNDSIHGSLNGESFSVFKSWVEGQSDYVDNHDNRFTALWNNVNDMFDIYDIPNAIKEEIIKYRSLGRPYSVEKKINIIKEHKASKKNNIILRRYQKDAIGNWERANYRGIFEMATGTGKTITSIASACKVFEKEDRLALIVVVPYIHLIEQWKKDMVKFGFMPILCSSEHGMWERDLKLKIQDFNSGFRKNISCIVTHVTAANDKFKSIIGQIKSRSVMCIYDEVHAFGAPVLKKALYENINYRLGLSATPQRWYDVHGTKNLMEYFGGVCYSFSLERAIEEGHLVQYKYCPHVVEMMGDEFEEYARLTTLINKLFQSEEDLDENPYLQSLLRARTKLINETKNKETILREIIKIELNKNPSFCHVLFYCPAGRHKKILEIVAELGIKAREFVHTVSNEMRQEILDNFANKNIQALVAMKCLDEGVDVPATKLAYIIASTTNPREFVQRRGRILRKYDNKEEAIIHDFIVIPPTEDFSYIAKADEIKKNILKREMPRFAEFASAAKNEFEARNYVRGILEKYYLVQLLDKRPWDIYAENNIGEIDLI